MNSRNKTHVNSYLMPREGMGQVHVEGSVSEQSLGPGNVPK